MRETNCLIMAHLKPSAKSSVVQLREYEILALGDKQLILILPLHRRNAGLGRLHVYTEIKSLIVFKFMKRVNESYESGGRQSEIMKPYTAL